MKQVHRFAYYFGGFTMGIIILFFFLNNKNASCNYFPDARVLDDIREKPRVYSPEALEDIREIEFDTTQVTAILHNGDVDFSRSDVHSDKPCNSYLVTGNNVNNLIEIYIKNCDSLATIESITYSKQ